MQIRKESSLQACKNDVHVLREQIQLVMQTHHLLTRYFSQDEKFQRSVKQADRLSGALGSVFVCGWVMAIIGSFVAVFIVPTLSFMGFLGLAMIFIPMMWAICAAFISYERKAAYQLGKYEGKTWLRGGCQEASELRTLDQDSIYDLLIRCQINENDKMAIVNLFDSYGNILENEMTYITHINRQNISYCMYELVERIVYYRMLSDEEKQTLRNDIADVQVKIAQTDHVAAEALSEQTSFQLQLSSS